MGIFGVLFGGGDGTVSTGQRCGDVLRGEGEGRGVVVWEGKRTG